MPRNKKQMRRLIMLVAELKQNKFPNTQSFAEKLQRIEDDKGDPIGCTPKTIQRDLKVLKEEFNAPIQYDDYQRGYYLKHHGWSFNCPIFEESELVSLILGARIAEEIFPNPLKREIREGTDNLLTENNPDLLDTATINALIVASGLKVSIDPEVFKAVFDAWTRKETMEIVYSSMTGAVTEREIEPHVLAYHDSAWFIKAKCLLRDDIRTFAVHRIQSARLTGATFELDPEFFTM